MFEGLNIRLFQLIHKGAGMHPFLDLCAIFFSETGPYILIAVAVITALGRVYSGIHFPFDMFGSLVVGALSSFCVFKGACYAKNVNGWFIDTYARSTSYICGAFFGRNGHNRLR